MSFRARALLVLQATTLGPEDVELLALPFDNVELLFMADIVAIGARTLVGTEAPRFAREERTADADIGTVVIEVATEVTSRVPVAP